jgi:hypothetical protein
VIERFTTPPVLGSGHLFQEKKARRGPPSFIAQLVAGFAVAINLANSAHGTVRPPWMGAMVVTSSFSRCTLL